MVMTKMDIIAAVIAVVINLVSMVYLGCAFFKLEKEHSLRLKLVILVRATYCAVLVGFMSYELS